MDETDAAASVAVVVESPSSLPQPVLLTSSEQGCRPPAPVARHLECNNPSLRRVPGDDVAAAAAVTDTDGQLQPSVRPSFLPPVSPACPSPTPSFSSTTTTTTTNTANCDTTSPMIDCRQLADEVSSASPPPSPTTDEGQPITAPSPGGFSRPVKNPSELDKKVRIVPIQKQQFVHLASKGLVTNRLSSQKRKRKMSCPVGRAAISLLCCLLISRDREPLNVNIL